LAAETVNRCSKKDVPLLPFSEVLWAKWGLRCACAWAKKLNSGLGFNSNNFTTWLYISGTVLSFLRTTVIDPKKNPVNQWWSDPVSDNCPTMVKDFATKEAYIPATPSQPFQAVFVPTVLPPQERTLVTSGFTPDAFSAESVCMPIAATANL
jgi:hypothetical protein